MSAVGVLPPSLPFLPFPVHFGCPGTWQSLPMKDSEASLGSAGAGQAQHLQSSTAAGDSRIVPTEKAKLELDGY